MQTHDSDLVGVGLYTISEAARLTDIPGRRISRWVQGYRYRRDDIVHELPPVWTAQIPKIENTFGLGFLDLMELRFVNVFREHGVPLGVIRLAAQKAGEVFRQDHPFTRKRFQTDGRRIFAEIIEITGETKLLDLVQSQYAFGRVIKPTLYASLEFSEHEDVLRWYPKWPKRQILLDPNHEFGRPIVKDGYVPTEVLSEAARTEESVERVARWFGVSVQAVRAAVEFEEELAA